MSKRSPPASPIRDKEFSAARRETLAKQGKAMPGSGAYPIENRADLKRAIQAFGRAEDKPATKAWIKKRAKALGATELLPENWDSDPAEAMEDAAPCPDCGGDGVDDDGEVCATCSGEGYVGIPASLEDRRRPPDDDDDDDDDDDVADGRRMRDSIRLVVDGGKIRKSADGYLVASARIARTGIQEYGGSELGVPDMAVVRVYRPPEEVFSKAAMQSMAHKPITFDHPPDMVDSNNWEKYAIGHIGDEVTRDGDTVRVPMLIMDGKAIRAYERDGVRELSVGYSTELKWEKGTTPDGEAYDAIQTAIRGNHLAVVPAARGGSRLRLGDEGYEGDGQMLVKTLIDGQTIEFATELAAKHVTDHLAALTKQLADAKKKDEDVEAEQEREKKERGEKDAAFAALKGENTALKKQLEDAVAKVDDAVNEKIDLLLKADAALEGKMDLTAKSSAAEIRRAVVCAKLGDAATKQLTDAEMIGAFKAVTADLKPRTGTDRLADSLSMLGRGGGAASDPRALRDAAYADYVARMSNAWKQPTHAQTGAGA
jgi:hypothetical protein